MEKAENPMEGGQKTEEKRDSSRQLQNRERLSRDVTAAQTPIPLDYKRVNYRRKSSSEPLRFL